MADVDQNTFYQAIARHQGISISASTILHHREAHGVLCRVLDEAMTDAERVKALTQALTRINALACAGKQGATGAQAALTGILEEIDGTRIK